MEVNMAKMLCGCILFWQKPKPVSDSLKSLSTPRQLSISEWRRFDHSRAPSPPERLEGSTKGPKSLVTPKREVVIEPSIEP